MPYISVGRRFLALLIDWLISLIWTAPFVHVSHRYVVDVFGATTRSVSYNLTGAPFLIVVGIWVAYFTLMEGAFGATIGKFAVGIRVVRADGGKIGWQAALVRSVGRVVDGFPWVIPYLLGAVMVWTSPTRQRIGDRWAKTVVVAAGSQTQLAVPGAGPQMPPAGSQIPSTGGAPMPPPPPMPPME